MRGKRHAMLSVERCREILGVDKEVSDRELERAQLLLRQVAQDIFNSFERGTDESCHIHQG